MRRFALALLVIACGNSAQITAPAPVVVARAPSAAPTATSRAPLADRDGDGVPDYCDYCPGEPGIDRADHPYGRGCPYADQFTSTVDFASEPVRFTKGVTFTQSLEPIARGMKERPNVTFFVIGHASSDEADGDAVSLARANAVRDGLVSLGVAPKAVEAFGSGASHRVYGAPLQASRRVTFDASYDSARRRAWDATRREVDFVPLPDLCKKYGGACQDARDCPPDATCTNNRCIQAPI